MPSAYWHYAVDGDGDGKVNLWQSEQDALTSAAHFLANLGWKPGFRWGREVKLPENVDYAWMGKEGRSSITEWQQRGLMTAEGHPLPSADIKAHLLLPAGHRGPAFLAYDNFHVILRWNNSEFYAIAVGHLADRIAGAPPLRVAPPELPSYTRDQMIAMQQALNEKGFVVGKPDGIIGPATRAGIRAYQQQENLIADGFPAIDVMQRLGISQ
jgi:membrane-bound lytic murein transglycosylase B